MSAALLEQLRALCADDTAAVFDSARARGKPINPYGGVIDGAPLLRPRDTEQLSAMMRLLHAAGQAVIPLGGATGLVGATRRQRGDEWYLSVERLRAVELIDPSERVAVVGAGLSLQALQSAAAAHELCFPVDLGARGSAQIGGLLSTNAGGERVFRYGMMRQQVLGLEVVLADGSVLDMMDTLIKNNAGYDLKQLFIGSEGTLGLITRAALRLRPALPVQQTAFASCGGFDDAIALLREVERGLGGGLSAYEVMWPDFYHAVLNHEQGRHRAPVPRDEPMYVLMEAELGESADPELLYQILERCFEQRLAREAAIAQSQAERESLWAVRNDIDALFAALHPSLSFDVSLPVAEMADYVDHVRQTLLGRWPEAQFVAFGHIADNNLHLVVSVGESTLSGDREEIGEIVHAPVLARRGSVSAEHGVGLDKQRWFLRGVPAPVLEAMRLLKRSYDPRGILNPGKVFDGLD